MDPRLFSPQTLEVNCLTRLDPLKVFPAEIIFKIFCCLELPCLCLCRHLSRTWRTHVNRYFGSVVRLDFVPHESILTDYGLKHMLKYVNSLRVLHLDTCWTSVTEENLFLIAQNCSQLTVLTASRCKGFTDAALEAVARHCTRLAEMDLSSCFKRNCQDCDFLVSGCERCPLTGGVHKGGFEYKVKPPISTHHRHAAEHAEMVSAYGMLKDEITTEISDAGVIALSEHCSNLQELHVSSCYGVTDKSIISLAQKCCGLEELDVSWCFNVTDLSIKLFTSPKCKLKLLRIKDCSRVSQGVVSQLMTKGIVVNNFF